jgi:N-acetylneuraminic acid mutarotase
MGLKKGCQPNNPNGRKVGSVNKVTYDLKTRLTENVNEAFMDRMFSEIEQIEKVEYRVKARIEVIKFLIPKPRDVEEVEKDNAIRDKLLIALALK